MADPRCLRLIFEYDGDRIDLVSNQPVDMVARSSEPLDDVTDRLGSWVEVRDQADVALHRQLLHDPIGASTEVFSPEPGASLRQVESTRQQGAFTVVVPNLPEADHVAFVADRVRPPAGPRPQGPAATAPPQRLVLRFPLHDNASEPAGGGHDDE